MNLARTIAGILIGAALLAGCGQGEPEETPEKSAASAPNAAVTLVDAPAFARILQQARGKTVVINFWATWCPPCVAEMPHFAEFYRQLDPAKTALLSVSVDDPATLQSHLQPFLVQHKLPFPVYLMTEHNPDRLSEVLPVPLSGNLPVTMVLKPDGTLAQWWEEPVEAGQLQQFLR